MAKVEALVLCRYAEVQPTGLLTVVSGGVTRAFAVSVPAMINPLHVAAMVYISPDEIDQVLDLRVCLKMVDTATKIAELVGGFQVGATDVMPGEGLHAPIAVNLSPVVFPAFGQVDVQVLIDNQVGADLSFWIVQQPT